MLKMLGAVLILISCTGYAGRLLGRLRRRRDILKSCVELAGFLAAEIRYERAPVAEALTRIAGKTEPELAAVLRGIAGQLESGDYGDLEPLWNERFGQAKADLLLTEEELAELRDMGKNLGFLDPEMQISHLTGCGKRLNRDLEAAEKELADKRRLYRCLSVAAGIFVILILI